MYQGYKRIKTLLMLKHLFTVSKTYDAKLDNLATTQQTSQDQQSTQNQSTANTSATNSNSELAKVQDNEQEVSTSNKSDQTTNINNTHIILMLISKHCKLLKTLLSSSQVQSNDDTSANSNQTLHNMYNQIDESSSNSQQENSLTSSNKNQLNSSSVTPSQPNQVAQSNNQIESKQSSDKKVSTYSNNDNNATQAT